MWNGEAAAASSVPFRWRAELRSVALVLPAFLVVATLLMIPLGFLTVQAFWTQTESGIDRTLTLANFERLLSEDGEHYWRLLARSLIVSIIATSTVLLLAYPAAYFLAFGSVLSKGLWLILLVVPSWISYLLRIFSWKVMLGFGGIINSGLKSLGLTDAPIDWLLYNPMAVTITLAHSWSAFAVLPIYVSLQKMDHSVLEASADLGDSPIKRFRRVTLPLSMPGVLAATVLVYVPVMGDYITPQLVGGTSGVMIGTAIASLFGKEGNAPLGAALSLVMMLAICAVLAAIWAFLRCAGLWRPRAST